MITKQFKNALVIIVYTLVNLKYSIVHDFWLRLNLVAGYSSAEEDPGGKVGDGAFDGSFLPRHYRSQLYSAPFLATFSLQSDCELLVCRRLFVTARSPLPYPSRLQTGGLCTLSIVSCSYIKVSREFDCYCTLSTAYLNFELLR